MRIDRYQHIPPLSFSLFFLAALSPLLFIVVLWITEPIVSAWSEARADRPVQSSQSNGLSEYQKCRLDYIGRRNLRVDRMPDHELFKMEAGIAADYPAGCGNLPGAATFENALDNTFDNLR